MVTLAQRYGMEDVELQAVAHQHHLPMTSFDGVVNRLVESGLVVVKGEQILSLKLSPEKITIWQVVACVSRQSALVYDRPLPPHKRTSTVIMVHQQGEALQNIISSRLKRCKLSQWSKRASETVYI